MMTVQKSDVMCPLCGLRDAVMPTDPGCWYCDRCLWDWSEGTADARPDGWIVYGAPAGATVHPVRVLELLADRAIDAQWDGTLMFITLDEDTRAVTGAMGWDYGSVEILPVRDEVATMWEPTGEALDLVPSAARYDDADRAVAEAWIRTVYVWRVKAWHADGQAQLGPVCKDCDDVAVGSRWDHVVSDDGGVIIGCEGYWHVDPRVVDIAPGMWS